MSDIEQYKDHEFVAKLVDRYRSVQDPPLDMSPAEIVACLVQCNKANLAIIPHEDFQELLSAWSTLQNPQIQQAIADGGASGEGVVTTRR